MTQRTIHLVPVANYPNGASRPFGPTDVSESVQSLTVQIISVPGTDFADPTDQIRVLIERSADGGSTWATILDFSPFGGLYFERFPPNNPTLPNALVGFGGIPCQIRGSVTVLAGPVRAGLDVIVNS